MTREDLRNVGVGFLATTTIALAIGVLTGYLIFN